MPTRTSNWVTEMLLIGLTLEAFPDLEYEGGLSTRSRLELFNEYGFNIPVSALIVRQNVNPSKSVLCLSVTFCVMF